MMNGMVVHDMQFRGVVFVHVLLRSNASPTNCLCYLGWDKKTWHTLHSTCAIMD